MYKFKNNHRKGVASGRLNNEEGIRALRMIHLDEISTGRAYTEISGKQVEHTQKFQVRWKHIIIKFLEMISTK